MKKLSVIKQKIESLEVPWCDPEAGTCHDIEDVEDFVKSQFKKAANDLEEKVEVLRTSTEAGLEKTLERADAHATEALSLAKEELNEGMSLAINNAEQRLVTDIGEVQEWAIEGFRRSSEALNLTKEELEAAHAELQARVDAIEEATEEEVLGALVEVPESVSGSAVGYVMLKKTVLGVKWKIIYESGSRYHKEATVELEALGDFELLRNDRVAVILDEPIRKADGTEIWNFNCRVEGVTEGKTVLEGDYYYSSSQEPVMPDILAGTMFMLYRQ